MTNEEFVLFLEGDSDLRYLNDNTPSNTTIKQWQDMIDWVENLDTEEGILTKGQRERLKVIKMIVSGWNKNKEKEGRERQDEAQI